MHMNLRVINDETLSAETSRFSFPTADGPTPKVVENADHSQRSDEASRR